MNKTKNNLAKSIAGLFISTLIALMTSLINLPYSMRVITLEVNLYNIMLFATLIIVSIFLVSVLTNFLALVIRTAKKWKQIKLK